MSRRLLTAAACGALLLGLAACGDGSDSPVTTAPPEVDISAPSDGGGGEPSDGGGESESSDGGGEPTAAAPDTPPPDPAEYAGMDENTAEGAEQAARYYVAVTIWAYSTGNLELHDSLVAEGCTSCQQTIDEVTKLNSHGEFWSETDIEDLEITHDDSIEEYDYAIRYTCRFSEHTAPPLDGGARETVPAMVEDFNIGMTWSGDRWIVGEYAVTSTEG